MLMCMKCTVYFMFKSGEMAPKGHISSKPPSAVGSVFIPTWNLDLCVSCESFELAKIHSTERVCYVDSFIFYSTLMFIICVNNPNIKTFIPSIGSFAIGSCTAGADIVDLIQQHQEVMSPNSLGFRLQ